jgi:hypothetical protein
LLSGTVYLSQVIDADILLGIIARADVAWHCDSRQQADDSNCDHDLHQRKTLLVGYSDSHT